MSRAEEAALKAYPEDWVAGYFDDPDEVTDDNTEAREYFQQGYEQAEKDILDRAIQWLTAHADDYIVDMEVSRYKPSNLHVGGMCWEHLRNYEKITCIIFIAHGHPRPCKREGPTKWEGSHAVRRQEK